MQITELEHVTRVIKDLRENQNPMTSTWKYIPNMYTLVRSFLYIVLFAMTCNFNYCAAM